MHRVRVYRCTGFECTENVDLSSGSKPLNLGIPLTCHQDLLRHAVAEQKTIFIIYLSSNIYMIVFETVKESDERSFVGSLDNPKPTKGFAFQ